MEMLTTIEAPQEWFDGSFGPWVEERPGVLSRTAHVWGVAVEVTLHQYHTVCQICRAPLDDANNAPVVHNSKWKQHFPNDGVVCTSCLEQRMGKITGLAALQPLPCNVEWIVAQRQDLLRHPQFAAWAGGARVLVMRCIYCSGEFECRRRPPYCPHCKKKFSITIGPKTTAFELGLATAKNNVDVEFTLASRSE